MTQKQATRRYLKVFFPAMAMYVISIMMVAWLEDVDGISRSVVYILTIVPALSIFVWMWAQWRYVHEIDEYLRDIQRKAMMVGMTIVMAISSAWGLLEFFGDVPKLPIFYVLPMFYLFYGLAHLVIARREGITGMCP